MRPNSWCIVTGCDPGHSPAVASPRRPHVPSNPLLGKFGPLVLVAVVQLVLVLAAPSTAPVAGNAALGAQGSPYATTPNGVVPGSAVGVPGAAGGGGASAGVPGAAGGGAAGGAAGGSTSGATVGGGAPAGAAGGDTKHCVAGRQFDPNIDYYAPPCVAGLPGAPWT